MNLISCEMCGVVLDTDRILCENVYDHDTGELIPGNSFWDLDLQKYMPMIYCPECEKLIFYHNGNKIE